MNFYKFHLGDYYKKASHLSMVEDGAYRRLIDAIYLREGPLPANREQVYRLVRAFTSEERAAVDTILDEFFVLTDAGYTNARCDEEMEGLRAKSEKASLSANRRWKDADAMRSHSERSTDAMRAHSEGIASHKPVTISQESSTPRASQPATNTHRMIAVDLLDRGKANLSGWERRFLEDVCAKTIISDKMQATLDGIAAKVGINADGVMATWQKRLEAARSMRQWDVKWGPPPRTIGCIVPDQLLQPGDGEGWSEWRAAS